MSTLKHNKKRNTGLVYEFLVRRMTSQMLDQDLQGYKKTLEITKKYFRHGTVLNEEQELFTAIRNTRGVSESVARQILSEARARFRKIDKKMLEIKKSNLIKEANYNFGRDFFSTHRVPEYRLLATIHMFLENDGTTRLSESVTKYQLAEGLVKFMTSLEPAATPQKQEKDVDGLVVGIAAKKFQEKYGKNLGRDQKELLEKYMLYTVSGDKEKLEKFIIGEQYRVSQQLRNYRNIKEIKEDPVMAERFDEASRQLRNQCDRLPLDESVEELMLYYKLVEEIRSNG